MSHYSQVLEPHFTKRQGANLGFLAECPEPAVLEYAVTRVDRRSEKPR